MLAKYGLKLVVIANVCSFQYLVIFAKPAHWIFLDLKGL